MVKGQGGSEISSTGRTDSSDAHPGRPSCSPLAVHATTSRPRPSDLRCLTQGPMTFNISTALEVVRLAPAPALNSPVASSQLDSLPEELLAQIASHLLPPPLTPIQTLLYGPFVGAYQDTDGEDFRWDYQLDQPKSKTKAQTLPSLVDLGSLRLVDRRWERASTRLLFGRVSLPSIERLEWLLERPRLAACVKLRSSPLASLRSKTDRSCDPLSRWLDILAHSLQEKAALDDSLPEAGCVLQALVRRMPALRQLSLQGPIPSSIINALRDPLTRNILKVDSLQALSLVNQSYVSSLVRLQLARPDDSRPCPLRQDEARRPRLLEQLPSSNLAVSSPPTVPQTPPRPAHAPHLGLATHSDSARFIPQLPRAGRHQIVDALDRSHQSTRGRVRRCARQPTQVPPRGWEGDGTEFRVHQALWRARRVWERDSAR